MPTIQVIPTQLSAAAAPLQAVGHGLRELADRRWDLQGLLDQAPTPSVRDAFDDFLGAWTPASLDLSDAVLELAQALQYAARFYADRESAIARGLLPVGRRP